MIDVIGLSKSYQKPLFTDLSMRFDDGKIYLITGANGSGKSTFLRCIAGFSSPDEGECRVEGTLLYQPQQAMLFPLSCYDNAIVGNPKADPASVRALFERLDMMALMNRGVRGLSGGERQKVTLIRSLVTGGGAVLLDEPFSALDNKSSATCLTLIQDYAKTHQVPLLVVSHAVEAATNIADHRIHFEEGRVTRLF